MKSADKIQNALTHKDTAVPIDFGSNAVTSMHCSVVAALRDHYGLDTKPVKVNEPFQMLGEIDEELKTAIGIDVDGIFPAGTFFGFRNENWKEWKTPWGQEVLVPGEFNLTQENGDTFIYPEGDLSAGPSARMPSNGFFFDAIIRQQPIDEDKLNPADNLEEFKPISQEDLDFYRDEMKRLETTDRAIFANFGGTGLGDIALVPAPFLKAPKGIRDITEWYVSTVTRQDYLHAVFAGQIEIALDNLEKIYQVVGDRIDAMFICGTDFGTQSSTFCSLDTFNELYFPYYKKMTDWIHQNTGWKVFKHSCGAVKEFIARFIDAGFDIINPVQASATGMDPATLKKEFGENVVFWGGGVDTQKTLPFGTPEEVREQVLKRCEIFSPEGGFVFNAIHNVQAKTPVENIVAMIDAVHEFNGKG